MMNIQLHISEHGINHERHTEYVLAFVSDCIIVSSKVQISRMSKATKNGFSDKLLRHKFQKLTKYENIPISFGFSDHMWQYCQLQSA